MPQHSSAPAARLETGTKSKVNRKKCIRGRHLLAQNQPSKHCNVQYVMLCPIWHHLYILKNVKNTHGGVLLLVTLQDFLTLFHGCFLRFLNCTNDTKSRNASHMFKVNNKRRPASVFTVNFEHISHTVLVFPLLTLNK